MISREFKTAIWLSGKPQWRIAQEASVSESVLSRLVNGRENAKPGDKRLIRISKIINFKGKILEDVEK